MDPTTPIPGITGVDAPPINAQYTDGSTFTLPSVNQPILVMDVWASWCGWCMLGMPGTQDLANWARDNGKPVKVVAVNEEEDLATIQATWAANGFTLPVVMDTNGKIFSDYGTPFGAGGIPFYVVVAGGKITWQQCGYSASVETLLKNEINRIVAMIPATNNPPTDITLSASSVPENQPVGASVGTFTTTDPDVGGTFTYTLVSGAGGGDNAQFTINGDQLKTAASFNFEAKNAYSIRVRTTDSGGLFFEKAFTISVTNVAEAPTNLSLSGLSIVENQPIGTVVGNFTSSDPDIGDTFTYTLVAGAGSNDNASFSISGNQLKTAANVDFDTKNSYSVRARTTDSGNLWFEKVFTISVTNVNETPTNITLTSSSISENQPSGTAVGWFSTTDPDASNTFTYSLVSGTGSTDNASFSISGNQLNTAASFDYETKNSYSIRVQSTDQGGLSVEKVFIIGVTRVYVAPTDIVLSNTNIAENQPPATVVGDLSSIDADAGDAFAYALVSGTGSTDNAIFTISGNQLKAVVSFDYEARNSYSIRIRTSDGGLLTFEKAFTISVIDVNEPATNLALSATTIAENLPAGSVVGSLSISDPDLGESYSYEILAGADSSAFNIVGDQLQTAVGFDYEAKKNYTVTIRVHDGALYLDRLFVVNVANVNECPSGINLSNTSVAENSAAGTVVGSLSTIDPDAYESYSYEILPGGDAGAFSLTGNQVKTAASFNYESKSSYSITVRVHDGAFTFDQPLTIAVGDVNESPADIAITGTSVPENQDVGTVVGTLSTSDPDSGESYSYEILPGGNATSFAIAGNQLTTAAVFDYEMRNNYSITVRVHDGSFTLDKPLTIAVTNLVEFGMIQGKAFPATITDSDGDLVTFSLSGSGAGTIQPDKRITLAGTTAASAFSIKVKKGPVGDGVYNLPGISSDGLIKSISGTAVNLSGEVDLNTLNRDPGTLAMSLKLRQISAADIRVQRLPMSSLAVTGDVSDSRIMTSGSIRKFSAAALLDSEILVGVTMGFGGDFAANGSDFANSAAILGSLKVAGRKLPSTARQPAFVAGSHISAPTVGTLTLLNVADASGTVVHVLNDVGTLKVTQSKLTSEKMVGGGTWNKAGARPVVWEVV